ncbi:MAG: oligogalacturonate lyase family protein [Dysgonamonadaceae bacterium]|jgi:oligogalacturonide lyase|nr:oligogalacturonate lyase family protein [Dysgonamonadaceae bacterium]
MRNLIVLLLFGLTSLSGLASNVGKVYPSEKHTIIDRITGRLLTVLTASSFSDAKPYQTHDTWTSDGKWIIFHSQRGGNGSQLFVVNELTGVIVQLTDDETVNAGSLNLSRKEMKLFFIRNSPSSDTDKNKPVPRQIVELHIGQLLQDALSDSVGQAADYERVVCTLPEDMRGNNLALDADETQLYLSISLTPPETDKRQAPQQPATNDRSSVDSRNTDPTEAREAARLRFETAGKGKSGIRTIDIRTGKIAKVIDVDLRMGHLQANPWTPGEIIYCHETTGDAPQRIWAVNADGSNHRPVYRETPDEWVTHETVAGADELMFNIMGHLPYLREKPSGIAVVNLRTGQMKLLGQVDEHISENQQGGFWHCNGSPDGRWATGDTFKGSIYLINRQTGEQILLSTDHRMRPDHTHPIFSPDSKRVLIQSGLLSDGKALNLMTINIESINY